MSDKDALGASHYVIRGGVQGRERLRVLARVMWPESRVVLEPYIGVGSRALDVGCGGGDVTLELARLAPEGYAVGIDMDDTKLALARGEAISAGIRNVDFRSENVLDPAWSTERYDVVYARFLLSHLPDAEQAVRQLVERLELGGVLIVEDIDSSGHYWYPECEAFRRFVELYDTVVRARGADPYIGPKLPGMLRAAGLRDVGVRTAQPTALRGDVKALAPLTFDAIADTIAAQKLASPREIATISDELWAFARDDTTVSSIPRVVQAWAHRSP